MGALGKLRKSLTVPKKSGYVKGEPRNPTISRVVKKLTVGKGKKDSGKRGLG